MTLEAAAQVLAGALMLLQTVSANPSLPQSVRDEAQHVAESAITAATRAMGRQSMDATLPSCTIVSDKYYYRVGEVVVFDWTSRNAENSHSFPMHWGRARFRFLAASSFQAVNTGKSWKRPDIPL